MDSCTDCDGNDLGGQDCAGICGGTAQDLGCGGGNPAPAEGFDCDGNCLAQDTESNELDEGGLDCAGTCGGSALLDECGQC